MHSANFSFHCDWGFRGSIKVPQLSNFCTRSPTFLRSSEACTQQCLPQSLCIYSSSSLTSMQGKVIVSATTRKGPRNLGIISHLSTAELSKAKRLRLRQDKDLVRVYFSKRRRRKCRAGAMKRKPLQQRSQIKAVSRE